MKKAFTLIELLVTVAIIAILATLLLPALGKCRDLAKTSGCLNNMRQLSSAVFSYASDYGGLTPVQNDAPGHTGYWKLQLSPYLGMPSTLNVNSDELSLKAFKCPAFSMTGPGGYGWNSGTGNLAPTNNGFGYQEGSATRGYVRLDSATRPSLAAVAGDSTDWTPNYPSDVWVFQYLFSPSCAASYQPSPPVGNRHDKGLCLHWADGHAERKTQNALLTGVGGDIDYYYKRVK